MRTIINIPQSVQDMARKLELKDPDTEIGISKHDDIYVIDSPVPSHIDNNPEWADAVICVLVNDPGYFFVHGSNTYDLNIGDIIKFDGNILHSVEVFGNSGRAVFLIWDVEKGENIGNIAEQMQKRINELI